MVPFRLATLAFFDPKFALSGHATKLLNGQPGLPPYVEILGPIARVVGWEIHSGRGLAKNVWTPCSVIFFDRDVSIHAGPIFWRFGILQDFGGYVFVLRLRLCSEFLASLVPAAAREVFRLGARGEGSQGFSIG